MRKKLHMCQSIEGALKNWSPSQWKAVARDNKLTVAQVKSEFRHYLREGKRVLPLSNDCEGFDYENGCPGHEINDPA
jgi:hypothetical protein